MYQIIAVDLDGTLLSSENKVTNYTKKIIHSLMKKKIYFILASGRHYIDVMRIKNTLEIDSFMITSNGASVYDLENKLIFSDNLNENIASKLCRMKYSDQDIITQIYQNNQWYINNNKIDNHFCSNLSILKYQYFNPENIIFNNISKIFFTSKNFKKLHILEKEIISYWSNQVNVSFSMPGCLEVISGKTSKGYGLKLISNLLGISLDNCYSFGDGMNDLDMLAISKQAYIMKNADSHLKDFLPHAKIIGSNNENGVAKCLSNIFIKNNKNIL